MIGLGFVVLFGGYAVMTYGWSQLRGSNASFVSLVWPGSFKGASADTGGASSSSSTTSPATAPTPANPNPPNPITAPPPGSKSGTAGKDTPFGGGQKVYQL